ncbi:hypothetical protein ACFSO7_11560 [Bacillus sp. CGMCC 1.16607]|uniref:hypothetical protein n=1 Tax=Bacillus sp. CGMCC 1.16607 TaxID=3351842 RepID=UPI0036402140
MVIIVSDTPKYLIPSNALLIKEEIKAVAVNIVYDNNANCIGMISAIDHVSRYLKAKTRLLNALVVGSFYSQVIANQECLLSYPTFGDGSCAILLQKLEEDTERGVIDTVYETVSQHKEQKNQIIPVY